MDRIVHLAVYWGIWLVLPVLVDGIATLVQIVQVAYRHMRRAGSQIQKMSVEMAGVSVIVPVYNGKKTLGLCLKALCEQNYPQEWIEIIVVDNGSTDGTAEVFQLASQQPFRGQMHWVSIAGRGKSYALNAGLHLSNHPYLCNVDADTLLHPDALAQMVAHFQADQNLGAATGSVEVLPAPPDALINDRIGFLIAECEFQEYLLAFWLGRQGQAESHSLYTLAGAFSFFRREVLLSTLLYDKQTVSEDTKVSFDVRAQFGGHRLGCVPEAVAYVTPTPSFGALYAQRVRWQRGELEVAALNLPMLDANLLRLRGLSLSRTLLIDHTFLFPRLVWTFLFPALAFFGYPLSLVFSAMLLIYIFYIFLAAVSMVGVYLLAGPAVRERLLQNAWVVLLVPLYRMITFVYRLAGSIIVLAEPAEWRVQDPWAEIRSACNNLNLFFQKRREGG
jgi:poly-beta-1,6-N-acetyl-D-glucosamine synthase